MKLCLVTWIGYSNDGARLVIAKNEREAERKVRDWLEHQCYRCHAEEVTEVDGYKIDIREKGAED